LGRKQTTRAELSKETAQQRKEKKLLSEECAVPYHKQKIRLQPIEVA
jgi:hypothetical protein